MASNPETAVAVVEQEVETSVVEWNLDAFPTSEYNRLIPTQTLSIPTDLLRPVVQVVQLNPDPKNGGDVYQSKDMPDGHAAPTKVGLRKFATAAGVSFVDERRTDDGTDPDVIEITCWAEMLLPTGQRLRAIGQKRVDLNAQVWRSPEHRGKFKSFFLEHVASRAENRAIRALLSLRGSYPLSVYSRPFAVVSFAPNMAHPEVRARILDAMAPTAAQLYGPAGDQRQLAPGKPIDVTPAPEEDPAPETPTKLPGETLAKADAGATTSDQPDWMSDAAASVETAVTLATTIRDQAGESKLKGKVTAPQLARLPAIFEGIGGADVRAGILGLFGHEGNREQLTSSQANALIVARDSFASQDAWVAAWAEIVEQSASAAA